MYASTVSASPSTRSVSIGGTVAFMWRLLSVVSLYWVLTWGCLDLWSAFFRSIQSCPPSFPKNGLCPLGSYYVNEGLCAPVPPTQEGWSGSRYCSRQELVVARGTALTGQVSLVMTFGVALSNVVIGAALIDSLGRKPVIVMGVAACCVLGFAFWCSCHMQSFGLMNMMIFGGTLFAKLTDSCHASCTVMISDLAQGNDQLQASGFSVQHMVRHVGILVAFTAGFPILKLELEDYSMVWACYSLIALAATTYSAVILQETLRSRRPPAAQSLREADKADMEHAAKPVADGRTGTGGSANGRLVDIMSETTAALLMVSRDPFLSGMMVCTFATAAATYGAIGMANGYQLSTVRLSQAHASLAGILQPTVIVVGSSIAPRLFKKIGVWKTFWLALLVASLSLFITGAGAYFRDFVRSCYWGGWSLLGISFGLLEPATALILSTYVDKQSLGKVFSVKEFTTNIGTGLGTYVWTNYIFAPSPGWFPGLGFFVSSVMFFCMIFLTFVIFKAYIKTDNWGS